MSNIFERATRQKLRFDSEFGAINVEDLWVIPLTGAGKISLDGIAMAVNRELKASEEESFVEVPTKENSDMALRLDVLKRIIEVRLADRDRAEKALATKAKKQQLLELLQNKENAELAEKSPEELRALLEAL